MADHKNPVLAQQRVEKVVFRGGGTKGLELVGAIQELEKRGAWQDVREVWGSSAGGVAAMLAGIGMDADEISAEMQQIDFKKFMDKTTPFWSEALGLKRFDHLGFTNFTDKFVSILRTLRSKQHGVFNGDVFADYAKVLISRKTGNPNITFRELHEAATNPESPIYDPRYKDIFLTGSKINPPPELKLYNWLDTPDMPIWQAVRITMSFPGAFKAVKFDPSTNQILKPGDPETGNEETLVDGGLKNNLPLEPAVDFSERKQRTANYHREQSAHVRNTAKGGVIGVSMEPIETIEAVQDFKKRKRAREEYGVIDFAKKLLSAPIENIETLKKFKDQIIMPYDLGQDTLNFEMDEDTKAKLLREGKTAAEYFCAARSDFANYQQYHMAADIEHIVSAWKRYNALQKELAQDELSLGEIGDIENMQILQNLADKYHDFAITFTGNETAYREKLAEIFQQRQLAHQQAIVIADIRRAKFEEETAVLQLEENLLTVNMIIQEFARQKQTCTILVEHATILLEINNITEQIIADANNPNIQQAFNILKNKIQDLARHKLQDLETFKQTLATATTEFTSQLANLELTPAQIQNFQDTLKLYANYSNMHPEQTLPALPNSQALTEFQTQLQLRTAEIQTESAALQNNLRQLEIDSYRNGMLLLLPAKQQEILAAPDSSCTITELQAEYAKSQQQYALAQKSGNLAIIQRNIGAKYYQQIVLTKQAAFEAINKSTGIAVKFADLLERNCAAFYKVFHFIASLNPLSTYKSVVLMRAVHKQLTVLQKNLETNANIFTRDSTSKQYIAAIEEMNAKINNDNTSNKEKNKTYQQLNKLLTTFEQHRAKIEIEKPQLSPAAQPRPSKND